MRYKCSNTTPLFKTFLHFRMMDSLLSEDGSFIVFEGEEEVGARASSNSESERFTPGQSSTPTKDFKCHICDRVFTRKDNLKRHFKIHEDTFIKCSICPRLFNNQHDMEEHKLKHSSVLCSACGASFKKNCHLLEHQFTVHKVEGKTHHNFVCQISGCGKKFVRQAFLQSHMNVHINVKPYRCAMCQNPFASQYACMRHERTCSTKSQITCKKMQKIVHIKRLSSGAH